MVWNHRVMKRVTSEGEWFTIHEVFYDNPDELSTVGWTEDAIAPGGETLEDLKIELERMLRCLEKPVLDYDARENFTNAGEKCEI